MATKSSKSRFMINTFNLSAFSNHDIITLGYAVTNICKNHKWVSIDAKSLQRKVKECTESFDEQMQLQNSIPETQNIIGADDEVYNSIRSLKYILKAHEYNPIEDKRKAATNMIQLFEAYGWDLHTETYRIQNLKLKRLLKSFGHNNHASSAIELLELDPFIDNLKHALAKLETALEINEKEEQAGISQISSKELHYQLHEALVSFFKYLDIMEQVSFEPIYASMVFQINKSIRRIQNIAAEKRLKSAELA